MQVSKHGFSTAPAQRHGRQGGGGGGRGNSSRETAAPPPGGQPYQCSISGVYHTPGGRDGKGFFQQIRQGRPRPRNLVHPGLTPPAHLSHQEWQACMDSGRCVCCKASPDFDNPASQHKRGVKDWACPRAGDPVPFSQSGLQKADWPPADVMAKYARPRR
jgi:hypothetical protein